MIWIIETSLVKDVSITLLKVALRNAKEYRDIDKVIKELETLISDMEQKH